jgi:hypothetical protein
MLHMPFAITMTLGQCLYCTKRFGVKQSNSDTMRSELDAHFQYAVRQRDARCLVQINFLSPNPFVRIPKSKMKVFRARTMSHNA